jgi:hypothetical protein
MVVVGTVVVGLAVVVVGFAVVVVGLAVVVGAAAVVPGAWVLEVGDAVVGGAAVVVTVPPDVVEDVRQHDHRQPRRAHTSFDPELEPGTLPAPFDHEALTRLDHAALECASALGSPLVTTATSRSTAASRPARRAQLAARLRAGDPSTAWAARKGALNDRFRRVTADLLEFAARIGGDWHEPPLSARGPQGLRRLCQRPVEWPT